VPKLFAPNEIADKGGLPLFDSSGTQCIFISDFRLLQTVLEDDGWTNPEPLDLGSGFEGFGVFGHGISADWSLLLFNSLRPAPDSCRPGRSPIWIMTRSGETWSAPRCAGLSGMAISAGNSGTIYFTTWVEGVAHLAMSRRTEDGFREPEVLPEPIMSSFEDMHPCIAHDESYIIFDSEDRPSIGPCQLFVSFRQRGEWTEPCSLGEWIPQEAAAMAHLSADDEYLFYNDRSGSVYWVNTAIIDSIKCKQLKLE
jgi:hypothetical protein